MKTQRPNPQHQPDGTRKVILAVSIFTFVSLLFVGVMTLREKTKTKETAVPAPTQEVAQAAPVVDVAVTTESNLPKPVEENSQVAAKSRRVVVEYAAEPAVVR